ncbi:MAG: AMP-binding protein, partial [Tatlockia sp.]|nr:AMP-binding protein [Tatlockia sp.]
EAIQVRDRAEGFDLGKPPLLRLHLIQQDSERYTLLQSLHHSIIDGWSSPVLLSKVHEYYEQRVLGLSPKVKVDRAYLRAQSYAATHQEQALAYWKNALKCIEQANDLNGLLSETADLDKIKILTNPQEISFQLEGDAYQDLKSLVKGEGLTTNVLVQFAWHKLLQVYTGDAQTVVGTTVSGRTIPVPGIEASVGLFINTLPLIVTWDSKRSVREQLRQIHQQITELNNHSVARLASLQQEGRRLFHSLFVFENYPVVEQGLAMSPRAVIGKLDYPLAVVVYETNGLQISLCYEGNYLTDAKAEQLVMQLQQILLQLPVMINEPHSGLSLVSKASYQQMIVDWNATEEDYPEDKTIHQLFEEQVLKTPDKIALVFEEETLSYQSLNEQSNQLARFIRQQYRDSLPKDCLIALCLDKSFETIIGILGILKAGAAYVPIDPSYPVERIHYLLEDSKAQLILTQTHLVEKLQETTKLVKLIALDSRPYYDFEKSNLLPYSQPSDLAYVMYTSGTTGLPKGAMIEHRNLCNLAYSQRERFAIDSTSIILLYAAMVFDVSVGEIFSAITWGAQLNILPESKRKDPKSLIDYLILNRITMAVFSPALLRSLNYQALPDLKILGIGGEFCELSLMKLWGQGKRFINLYGPAENTVYTTAYEYKAGDLKSSIGRPFPNIKVFILDKDCKPVPLGAIGELYISGASLGRGYLNQPTLTSRCRLMFCFQLNQFATLFIAIKSI